MKNWFEIDNIEEIDSPSIVLYESHLMYNLHRTLDMVDNNTSMLMPHVKTNKMPKVIQHMVALGITNFKSSTISEAEIAAQEGAENVLIAHQLVGPKIQRFGALINSFPNTRFSTILDNLVSAEKLNNEAVARNIKINVFIDINNGMNRSGIELGSELSMLIARLSNYTSLNFKGLHVYDGHLRNTNFQKRKNNIKNTFSEVNLLFEDLKRSDSDLQLISGGTPSFTTHLTENNRICSPGTCIFWDWGYDEKLTEQEFKFAVLLVSRVISKPKKGIVTIDLGHKSVAAENPIHSRVKFLNVVEYELLSQSEEHGVLKVKNWDDIKIGDVFYGVPYHICPTINLHDDVSVIVNNRKVDSWNITARKRKITI